MKKISFSLYNVSQILRKFSVALVWRVLCALVQVFNQTKKWKRKIIMRRKWSILWRLFIDELFVEHDERTFSLTIFWWARDRWEISELDVKEMPLILIALLTHILLLNIHATSSYCFVYMSWLNITMRTHFFSLSFS